MILRVVMRVPFDPTSSDADVQNLIEQRIMRTQELAEQYAELDKYEQLDIHMYHEPQEEVLLQEPQEKVLLQKTFHKDLMLDSTRPASAETPPENATNEPGDASAPN